MKINSDETKECVYRADLPEYVTGKFLRYNDGIVWFYFNEIRTITGANKFIQINLINQRPICMRVSYILEVLK